MPEIPELAQQEYDLQKRYKSPTKRRVLHKLKKDEYSIIDQALSEIEIQKQILEILKNKKVDVFMVDITNCVGEYNVLWKNEYQLTEEEYNLLKEWLKNGK